MTTVAKLIELLSTYPQDWVITDEQNRNFNHISMINEHVILSVNQPIGLCNRTGSYVFPSLVKGYSAFSPELDEDLMSFEFDTDMSEMRE